MRVRTVTSLCLILSGLAVHAVSAQQPNVANDNAGAAITLMPANSPVVAVDNVAAMNVLVSLGPVPRSVITRGYFAAGDGGGAIYDWSPGANGNGDGIFTIQIKGAVAGRYILRHGGEINPKQAGAKCDATVDGTGSDDAKILNYVSAVFQTAGGGTIKLSNHICRVVSSDLILGRRVSLVGVSNPRVMAGAAPANFFSGIALAPNRSVVANGGSLVARVLVVRDGLGQKPADMPALIAALKQWQSENSTGIRIVGEKAVVEESMVVGFNKCLSVVNAPTPAIRNFDFDCINGIVLEGVHDTPSIINTNGNNFWGFNLTGRQSAWDVGAVVAGGRGYKDKDVLTVSGGTCTIQPQLTVVTKDGAVTGGSIINSGDCKVFPPEPISLTGGAGEGANIRLISNDAAFRPGIGYSFVFGEGGNTFSTAAIGWKTGVFIRNWYGLNMTSLTVEGGHFSYSHVMTGVRTEDCAANIKLVAPYVDTSNYLFWFGHRDKADGGSCDKSANHTGFVTVTGGHAGTALGKNGYPNELMHMAPNSKGSIIGTQFGGGIDPRIKVEAHAYWTFSALAGTNWLDINRSIDVDPSATVEFASEIYGGPASATDACAKGQRRYDMSYRYLCVSKNHWVRTPVGSPW